MSPPPAVKGLGCSGDPRHPPPPVPSTPSPSASSTTTPPLDPISATYLGLPGYDDVLTDLSPDGYAARADLTRRALADATAATPVDEREQVAKDAFLERLGLEVELDEAGVTAVPGVGDLQRAARGALGLRPDADRGRGGVVQHRGPARGGPGHPRGLPRHADRGGGRRRTWPRSVSSPPSPSRCAAGPGRTAASNFFLGLVAGTDVDGLRGDLERQARLAQRRRRRVRPLARAPSSRPAAATRTRSAASSTPSAPATSSAPTIDLEETYAWGCEELKRIEDEMDRVADQIVPGGSLDEAVAALEADPARRDRGHRDLPRLDAGPGRPHPRRHGRHALRHPRADPPDRVLHRADPRRRHLLHRPERGLHARPGGCGGRCPTASTSFATWREVTTVYHEGVPGHHLQVAQTAYRKERAQPLAAADVLGLRARRGLGALRRAADGRARLPRRPRRQARHARRPGLPGRPRRRRHRHAPRARDPARQPVRLPPGRDAGRRELGLEFMRAALPDGGRVHPLRGQPLPRLAGSGAVVQGGRADLAAGPRGRPGPARAPTSTSRPSTARRSTSARSGSTRCAGRAGRASRDPAGPGLRLAGPAGHAARAPGSSPRWWSPASTSRW